MRRRILAVVVCFTVLLISYGVQGATYTVVSTADGPFPGPPGSLREAINLANGNIGADTINFALPGPSFTISPATFLPPLTDPAGADRHYRPGPWWVDWKQWLAGHCGPLQAPPPMGRDQYPALEPAPGTYVLER